MANDVVAAHASAFSQPDVQPLDLCPLCRFIGEWYKPEEGRGTPTEEQIHKASSNCFITGAIYIAFTIGGKCNWVVRLWDHPVAMT